MGQGSFSVCLPGPLVTHEHTDDSGHILSTRTIAYHPPLICSESYIILCIDMLTNNWKWTFSSYCCFLIRVIDDHCEKYPVALQSQWPTHVNPVILKSYKSWKAILGIVAQLGCLTQNTPSQVRNSVPAMRIGITDKEKTTLRCSQDSYHWTDFSYCVMNHLSQWHNLQPVLTEWHGLFGRVYAGILQHSRGSWTHSSFGHHKKSISKSCTGNSTRVRSIDSKMRRLSY